MLLPSDDMSESHGPAIIEFQIPLLLCCCVYLAEDVQKTGGIMSTSRLEAVEESNVRRKTRR
jgi:hypothetical protein